MQLVPLVTGPMGVAEIIDRAFRLYRHYFRNLIIVPLLTYIPLGLLQIGGVLSTSGNPPESNAELERILANVLRDYGDAVLGVGVMVGVLVSLAAGVAAIALTNAASIQAVHAIGGEPLPTWPAVYMGLRRFWGLLGLGCLFILGLLPAIGIVIFLPCLLIAIVPLVVYVVGRMAVASAAFYAENAGPAASIKSSWRLTEGYLWRSVGFTMLLSLFSAVMTYGIGVAVGAAFELALPAAIGSSLSIATTAVINAFWLPIGLLANMLYYYDLRVRQDGYDLLLRIEKLAAQVDSAGVQ